MNKQAYTDQLMALMPQGQAWNTEKDSTMRKVLGIFSSELSYIHGRADTILREALPNTTEDLLADWEHAAGLPDNCSPLADTREERIAALVSRITRIGGQSREFFIAVAAEYGYEVEIDEFRPYMCGISRCGEDDFSEGHDCRFVWIVRVLNAKLLYLRCGTGTFDQRLLDFREADDLACILLKLKPAHAELIIAYEGIDV